MTFKAIKNDSKYHWTEHSKFKMQFYGISPQRAIRVIRAPHRTEEGIVEKTVAVMQPGSTKRGKDGKEIWSSEIWVMYQIKNKNAKVKNQNDNAKFKNDKIQKLSNKLKANEVYPVAKLYGVKKLRIISVWRYPGVSPKNNPIPEDILRGIEEII